jgi:hypothetical protein
MTSAFCACSLGGRNVVLKMARRARKSQIGNSRCESGGDGHADVANGANALITMHQRSAVDAASTPLGHATSAKANYQGGTHQ